MSRAGANIQIKRSTKHSHYVPIVLASTPRSKLPLFFLRLECIRALLQCNLNCILPLSSFVALRVQAAHTGAKFRIANLALLKACTVQFQTAGTDTVASIFTWRDFLFSIASSCSGERPRVTSEDGLNCLWINYNEEAV